MIDGVTESVTLSPCMKNCRVVFIMEGAELQMTYKNLCPLPFDGCPKDETFAQWQGCWLDSGKGFDGYSGGRGRFIGGIFGLFFFGNRGGRGLP